MLEIFRRVDPFQQILSRTSGHSTHNVFIFMANRYEENASLKASRESESAFKPSILAMSVLVSSASSTIAGARNSRPVDPGTLFPDRASTERDPWETRRNGVRACIRFR
jgi:hypothetical protein